jgi:hypothetical protein
MLNSKLFPLPRFPLPLTFVTVTPWVVDETVIATEFEVLGLKLLLPEYDADTMSEPRGSEDVENVATPEDNVTGAPKFVPLVLNCTLPVAELGEIMAVNVTECPEIIEVAFELREMVDADIEFTVCVITLLVPGTLFMSPRYFATIVCDPVDSDDVENVAMPEDNTDVPNIVGGVVLVSLNWTEPVAEIGKTEDVKVIDCPVTDGFCDDTRDIVVPICCTAWERMLVLAAKIALPEYVDDMECVPTDNDDTTNEAWPAVRATGLPVAVPSTRNCIVPVGTSEPETGTTVAVKFTDWPNVEGSSDDAMVVVVPIVFTVCASMPLVLGKLLESPAYLAIMLWVPADSDDMENVAEPPDIIDISRMVGGLVLVSLKITMPVAVGGVTVAVKDTGWPSVDGFCDDAIIVVVASTAKAGRDAIGATSAPDNKIQTSGIPKCFNV